MAKQNIAVQFEQAEFYTLQEASDYLNLKHGISNITPKKLLKHFLRSNMGDIGLFLHYQIDFDIQKLVPSYMKLSIYKDIEFQEYISQLTKDEKQEVFKELEQLAVDSLYNEDCQCEISNGQYFFELDYCTLRALIANSQTVVVYSFENFIHEYDLLVKKIKPKATTNFEFMGKNVKIDDFLSINIELYNKDSANLLKTHSPYKYHIERNNICYMIGIDDLIIIHDDLIKLESKIINNVHAIEKQQLTRGKSQAKQNAQDQAKIIAKALWNNDKDKKIRMLEMAELVYSELFENGYMRHLPDNRNSLKDWIKDIAPPYASEAGRPPKE